MKKYKTFTEQEIAKMGKEKLAKAMGIEDAFDTAVPQPWLNEFTKHHKLDYQQVLRSSFMVYHPGDCFGNLHSGDTIVQEAIEKDRDNWEW